MIYDFYTKYAKFYNLHTPDDHYRMNLRYISYLIKKYSVKSILDVGCGNGATLSQIRKKYRDIELSGFDISDDMIEEALKRKIDIDFFIDDMSKFNFVKNSYDLIISLSWVVNYSNSLNELKKVLNNIYKKLNDNGLILLEVPHIPNIIEYVFHDEECSYIDEYHFKKMKDVYIFFKLEKIDNLKMKAIYNLIIKSKNIIMHEEHLLNFCNAKYISNIMREIGFKNIYIMDNAKEHNLNSSYNVLIKAFK